MAFSGSSYFFGIGTAFAAIAVGFAGGAMITTSAVQPPNRLERVNAGITAPPNDGATTSSGPQQASTAKPPAQDAPPSPVVAAAPPAPAADPQPSPQSQPAAPAAAKTDAAKTDAAANVQEKPAPAAPTVAAKNSGPAPVAKSDDAAPAKSERTTVGRAPDPTKDVSRSADLNRDPSRKRADDRKPSDDRKFSDRRRRQDQRLDQDGRRLDEATNVIRQMPRGEAVDEIVERDDAPRPVMRPHHFEFGDDDGPRMVREPPPRFGLFGFGN
jgi:hypothetical protein